MGRNNETDIWGSQLGTQAACINELLSAKHFQSAHDVYDVLVREFPSTTVGRVHAHFAWLRENHPARLQRREESGRQAFYRLVALPGSQA